MALRYHPDKNNSPGAEAKFKEVAKAYDVLSDESKKRITTIREKRARREVKNPTARAQREAGDPRASKRSTEIHSNIFSLLLRGGTKSVYWRRMQQVFWWNPR